MRPHYILICFWFIFKISKVVSAKGPGGMFSISTYVKPSKEKIDSILEIEDSAQLDEWTITGTCFLCSDMHNGMKYRRFKLITNPYEWEYRVVCKSCLKDAIDFVFSNIPKETDCE
jgi:hypothetical protein